MRVFITGASSGIGAAMAKKFDAMGAQLGLVGRSQEKLDAVLSSMQNAQAHTTYALDVTDRAALFAAARDFDGKAPVDIVLANAGISIGVKTEYEEDLDVLEKVYPTNVFAMAATFHPFIEPMSKRGGGQFAGIGSVGGIRGLGELKRRVDSGEMKAAFALYPVSMQQLINIADTGNIMPPKTTWFEPKLRSGVVIHSFDEK